MEVPYYEDVEGKDMPGRRTGKTPDRFIEDCVRLMRQLGAEVIDFEETIHDGIYHNRYGYNVYFDQGGQTGVIPIAGLPFRSHGRTKVQRVRATAMYQFRMWLEAQVFARYILPDHNPLESFIQPSLNVPEIEQDEYVYRR